MEANLFARFIDSDSKRGCGRGRTSLYTPPSNGSLSVFTADNAPEHDLLEAGCYVACEKNKEFLYGWSCMTRASYAEFDLTVTPCEDNIVFGACRHMEVLGWPDSKTGKVDVAQELSKKEHSRHILPKRLSTKLDC